MWTKHCRPLLAGDVPVLTQWLESAGWRTWLGLCLVIGVCGGLYGATIGLWRDGLQAMFTAIKFPLLIALTCAGNAVLNGCLASLLGSRLGFRQTTLAILMSFAAMSLILAAFAPVMLFLLWNTPPLNLSRSESAPDHAVMLLTHTTLIACAGVAANRRLFRLVAAHCPRRRDAVFVVLGWLAGNLLLGNQLAWILRPFVGSPTLPVAFLRPHPLEGNFFEAIAFAIRQLTH